MKWFLSFLMLLALGCGDGPIKIDVDIPIDQDSPYDAQMPNTLATTDGSTVFFQFDPLVPAPTSIDSLSGGPTISFPSLTEGLFDASLTEFDVSQAALDENTLYRVTMFGTVDGGASFKYGGKGDCPLLKRLGSKNIITICFGLNGTSPVCSGTRTFSSCPLN